MREAAHRKNGKISRGFFCGAVRSSIPATYREKIAVQIARNLLLHTKRRLPLSNAVTARHLLSAI
jgi:hypothetical protein